MKTTGGAPKRIDTPEMALRALRIMGFHSYPLPDGKVLLTHSAIPGELIGEPDSRLVSLGIVTVGRTAQAMRQSIVDALEVDR